jgi:hypothetical protein
MTPIGATGRAPGERHGSSRVASLAVVFALVVSACSSTTPTASPAETGSGAPGSPSATTPLGSGQPGPSGAPGPGGQLAEAVLPLPTMTEPGAIGEALYDPTRMDVAVVSLLNVMGVGIYARDGTPIRKGAERAAGDPWLFDTEVRGLIDMGIEDLLSGAEGGGPFALSDLYESLAPQLDRQISLDEFVAAYSHAYAQHPDDLVPQALLGQPIEASMPLTRVPLSILLMDGFEGPAEGATAALPPGAMLAQVPSGPHFGTAQAGLPRVSAPPGINADDWEEFLDHLPTLADTIRFVTYQSSVHEGHGGTGSPATQKASVGHASPLVSPVTGHTLLAANTGGLDGIDITWASADEGVLREHGSLSAALPAHMATDASGGVAITYTPKKEAANGKGVVANDFGSLMATADKFQLVNNAYVLPNVTALMMATSWIKGRATAQGQGFTIEWHTAGLAVTIVNEFDVTIDLNLGFTAHVNRVGADSWEGVLTKRKDGTWRGTLQGLILGGVNNQGHADFKRSDEGTLVLPLAGGTCKAEYTGGQSLTVVGRPRKLAGKIDPDLEPLISGDYGPDELVLSFYPASAPYGDSATCSGQSYEPYLGPPYVGPGPDGRPMSGTYAAFNDSRFTSPSPGYAIHLPLNDDLTYEDKQQFISMDALSLFTVTVKRTAP